MVDVSVVIPFVHEYPALIQTVFAIQNEFVDLNYDYEIIIVENRERDNYTDKFLHYMRTLINKQQLKYFFEERPCGPIARNTGAKNARGKYLMFTDAHVVWGKNSVPLMIKTLEETGAGLVHGTTVWSHYDQHHAGAHYKLFDGGGPNLFSHMHGTYQRRRDAMQPYKVAGGTHAFIIFHKEEFLWINGYNEACRYYPHPEGYIDLKYWMFGRECWLEPRAFHYHSLYPRNYGAPPVDMPWHDHTIRNVMICAYTLGGEEWLDKVYSEWLSRKAKPEVLDKLKASAIERAKDEREWILNNAVRTLDETLLYLHKEGIKGMEVLPLELSQSFP